MSSFLIHWAESTWAMVTDSALLLLLSFGLAGLVSLMLNAKTIRRLVSGGKRREVFLTALVGVPLPLCSCSVLPVAYQMRKSGVSRAGTSSFLISTPESGVDSIVLTWSLMDPVMTVARPVAAFLTAYTAGNVEASCPDEVGQKIEKPEGACCASGCGCAQEAVPIQLGQVTRDRSTLSKIVRGIRYGYTDLFNDLAVYLLVGYVLAGLVGTVFGGEMLTLPEWLRSGWGSYAGAMVVGVPLYVCATSSTPLAAALIAVGFSPGAALVFLLVGPATNVASVVVVSKILGRAGMVRYLVSIAAVAVLCGVAIDWVYRTWGLPVNFGSGGHEHVAWYHVAAGVVFAVMVGWALVRRLRARRT